MALENVLFRVQKSLDHLNTELVWFSGVDCIKSTGNKWNFLAIHEVGWLDKKTEERTDIVVLNLSAHS